MKLKIFQKQDCDAIVSQPLARFNLLWPFWKCVLLFSSDFIFALMYQWHLKKIREGKHWNIYQICLRTLNDTYRLQCIFQSNWGIKLGNVFEISIGQKNHSWTCEKEKGWIAFFARGFFNRNALKHTKSNISDWCCLIMSSMQHKRH